jgi:hypothetical protein
MANVSMEAVVSISDPIIPEAEASKLQSSIVGAKIFVLAPNGFKSHFNLFLRLVEILLNQEWVQHIVSCHNTILK